MDLRIKLATLADLAALEEIEKRCFSPAFYHLFSRRQFRHFLTKGNAEIYLAVCEGKIAGYILALYKKNSRYLRIYSIALLADFRDQGIGRALFDFIGERALQLGLKGLTLEIRQDNVSHRIRYEKAGYVQTYSVPAYYPDGSACLKFKKDIL